MDPGDRMELQGIMCTAYDRDLWRQTYLCWAKDCDPVIGCPRTGPTVGTTQENATKGF